MSSRLMPLRMMGILLFAIANLGACVEPDDGRGPESALAARNDDGADPADPAEAPAGATSRHDDGGLGALIDALRTTGVGDYDARLGDLDWGRATLEHVAEGGYDVVLVPIVNGSRSRTLAARVEPGARGPTFETAILELTIDPETGELTEDIGVRNADGTARAIAGIGDFPACVTAYSTMCVASCGPNLSCLVPCIQNGVVLCFVHHVLLYIWLF